MKKKVIFLTSVAVALVSMIFAYTASRQDGSKMHVSSVVLENVEALAYNVTESDGSSFDCGEPYSSVCFTSLGQSFPGTKK
ncbi:MAG: hypothetical protein E7107_13215 [Prevotella sp.]|jgi:hypothetical protein|nr:hypothetical protein [Prevotella sp.]